MKQLLKVPEYGEVDIRLDQFLLADGSIAISPVSNNYFDFRRKSNRVTLVAKGYVGTFPLSDSVSVLIQPRCNVRSLARLLGGSDIELKGLNASSRFYGDDSDYAPQVFEILVNHLNVCLRDIYFHGLWKEYRRERRSGSAPKGRWLFSETMHKNWSKAQFQSVQYECHEQTVGVIANSLVKKAIQLSLSFCKNLPTQRSDSLKKDLHVHLDYFQSVPDLKSHEDAVRVSEILHFGALPSNRYYYFSVLEASLRIVNGAYPDILNPFNGFHSDSYAISMAYLFEAFILKILKDQLRNHTEKNVRALDGNKEGKKSFFSDVKSPTITPDYVIEYGGRPAIILDAKYKNKSKEKDRYQVIAHAFSYNVKVAVLVLPLQDEGGVGGLIYSGRVGSESTVDLFEYRFDIDAESISDEKERLCNTLIGLVAKYYDD